jgi:hypothetical protein
MATTCRYRSNSAGDHSGAVSGTFRGTGRGGSSGKVSPTAADPASGGCTDATTPPRTAIMAVRPANSGEAIPGEDVTDEFVPHFLAVSLRDSPGAGTETMSQEDDCLY